MTDMTWRKIFLVVEQGEQRDLDIIEREGRPFDEGDVDDWIVNMRASGCGSKLLEVLPAIYIHETREVAEKHLAKLIEKRAAEKKEG